MKTKTITRIFLCNRDERYDIENEIEEAKEKIAKGEIHLSTWSCGTLQELQIGDRVYFKRVGSKPHGFFAQGRIVAAKTEQTRLKSKKFHRLSATYSGEYPNLRFTFELSTVAHPSTTPVGLVGVSDGQDFTRWESPGLGCTVIESPN